MNWDPSFNFTLSPLAALSHKFFKLGHSFCKDLNFSGVKSNNLAFFCDQWIGNVSSVYCRLLPCKCQNIHGIILINGLSDNFNLLRIQFARRDSKKTCSSQMDQQLQVCYPEGRCSISVVPLLPPPSQYRSHILNNT